MAARGRLMQATPGGAMLAVFRPEAETKALLDERLCLAAVNSTSLCVVSGPAGAVDELEQRLAADGIGHRRLHTSHAFHSALVEGAVEPFTAEVRKIRLHAPQTPFTSNVSGTWISDEQATDPEYWAAHLRSAVRFADDLSTLLADPDLLLLEVGPGQTLSTFARQHHSWTPEHVAAGTLHQPREQLADRQVLLNGLGAMWAAGADVNWEAHHAVGHRARVRLPSYRFQRQRYWVEPGPVGASAADPVDWTYCPSWRRLTPSAVQPSTPAGPWLVLGADQPFGHALSQCLQAAGSAVVRVSAGAGFAREGERVFTVDPANREDYQSLFAALDADEVQPERVLHLWSLANEPGPALDPARLEQAQTGGFYSLLALAQALSERPGHPPTALDVLTRGVFSVTGEEQLQPENATVLGPCTVIPQEIPGVACRVLDLTSATPDTPLGPFLEGLRSSVADPVLAWRGHHWWARTYDTVHLDPAEPGGGRLRDEGVYLITGGMGGIGLAIAEHLARSVRTPVIGLLGRSAFPAEEAWEQWLATHDTDDATSVRIQRLRALQGLGARPVVLCADVTDLEETSRVVDELRARFGALAGVVHAAGVPAQGLLASTSRAAADAVLAAKTRGTLVLDAVCARDPLDFFVLFSSRTAILGGPGQADYSAANAFLDAFAASKATDGSAPVTAVAWDTWRDTGMSTALPALPGDGEDFGHPLLQRRLQKTEAAEVFRTTLRTSDSWIVDEHRMLGHGLVPGTTYLEMVRAAVAPEAAGNEIEFRDVLFTLPVIVPDGQTRDLYTTLERKDGNLSFRIQSRAPGLGRGLAGACHWFRAAPRACGAFAS
nr:hypothetical protein GCM10020092_079900 [Actinoplanes digitatis]